MPQPWRLIELPMASKTAFDASDVRRHNSFPVAASRAAMYFSGAN